MLQPEGMLAGYMHINIRQKKPCQYGEWAYRRRDGTK